MDCESDSLYTKFMDTVDKILYAIPSYLNKLTNAVDETLYIIPFYFYIVVFVVAALVNIASIFGLIIARTKKSQSSEPNTLSGWIQLTSVVCNIIVITRIIQVYISPGVFRPSDEWYYILVILYVVGMLFSMARANYNLQKQPIFKYFRPLLVGLISLGILAVSVFFGSGVSIFSRPVTVSSVQGGNSGKWSTGWVIVEYGDSDRALVNDASRGKYGKRIEVGDTVWISRRASQAAATPQYITSLTLLLVACVGLVTTIVWIRSIRKEDVHNQKPPQS